jgi:hypothetical protein
MNPTDPEGSFRWDDLDQTLVSPRLSKLAAEMHETFVKDEAQISFEGRNRGNSAYFLATFLDKQLERVDEWARRAYEIYCECLYAQGRCITPQFIRAVYKNAIEVLMHLRKASITDHFTRRAHMTGEPLNQHCLNNFARRMDVLANTWLRELEAEARALEHNSYVLPPSGPAPMSPQQVRQAILDCESRLTEMKIETEAQKQALALATANSGPVSKILQAIRRLSVAKVNLEKRHKEYEQLLAELDKTSNATKATKNLRKRPPRPKSPCFETAVALLARKPNLSLVQFCREMDSNAEKFRSALKYRPPESWNVQSFYEQYKKRGNTVSRFVSAVRGEIARRGPGEL